MARTSMAGILTRLRRLVGDPAGAGATWTDDELQDFLDARRDDAHGVELTPAETVAPGGAVQVLDYYAPAGLTDWEADAALADGEWAALTPATADCLTGHWTFAADQPAPVYLTGRTYDLCAAAADLLEAWAGRVKLAFDFSTGDEKLSRGQQAEALLGLAERLRARQRLRVGRIGREE